MSVPPKERPSILAVASAIASRSSGDRPLGLAI